MTGASLGQLRHVLKKGVLPCQKNPAPSSPRPGPAPQRALAADRAGQTLCGQPADLSQDAIDLVATEHRPVRLPAGRITTDEKLVILTGHTRRLAALQLGLNKVPVITVTGLTAAQARAYGLMDNKSHEATSWNTELLQSELAALVGMEFDPALTGFSSQELAELLAPVADGTLGLCDPDQLVEPPAKPDFGPAKCVCWAVIA